MALRAIKKNKIKPTTSGIYTISMMVTSSLSCGEFYIELPCAHYAGDLTIIQYIVYSMLIGPIY